MAGEVATAWVTLAPSARGFGRQAESQIGPQVDKAGKGIGSRLMGGMGKTMKVGAVAAGGAVAGIMGTALVKGFGRLQGIEQAEAKLRGLGHSAKGVETIMDSALGAVKGTAFGLDSAATVAASAVAAGIKPGKELQRTLTLVGDAATIAGTDMGSMGAIFNKVAASNKLQMDVINQLHDAGVPALQLVAKEMGVTAEEAQKMASKGEVNFETFQKAMESGLGGAAQESGKTFSGALANMQAALGRLGASVLSGAFAKMPNLFGKATTALDGLGPVAEKVGAGIGKAMTRAADAIRRINWSPLVAFATSIRTDLIPAIAEFGKMVGRNLLPLFEMLGPPILAVGAAIAESVVPALTTIFEKAVQFEDVLVPLVAGLAAGALAFKTYAAAVAVVTAAKAAWVAVQLALNVALTANPIGLVIAAIAALAVGLTVAYKRSETFRNIVNGALGAVKGAAQAFGRAVAATFNAVVTAVQKMRSGIAAALTAVVGLMKGLPGRITSALGNLASLLVDKGKQVIDGLWQGAIDLWGTVGKWFRERGERIKGYIGDLSGLLTGIGKAVIDGFLGGMRSAWDKGKGFVTGIAGWIAKNKGPIQKDRKLLIPAGVAIMAGFGKGLRDRFKKIKADVKKVAPEIMKALKQGLKRVQKDANKLSLKIDLFKSIRDQVKSAFSPDLFSGTLSEFLSGLSTQLASNKAVKAALPKLRKTLGKDFFKSLMASGNSQLILGLAGADASALKQVEKDWLAMNKTAGDIGKTTAKDSVGRGLAGMQKELKTLNKTVKKLDKAIGKEVGKSINRGSRKGKRNAKKG